MCTLTNLIENIETMNLDKHQQTTDDAPGLRAIIEIAKNHIGNHRCMDLSRLSMTHTAA